jgi:hypothetical protein
MNKRVIMVLVCLFLAGSVTLAVAEEKKEGMDKKDMTKGCMMHEGKKGCCGEMMEKGKMMGMSPMMMGKSLVSTSDGGVVVLMGNKLQKYDKDLTLVKEVEIKMDMEAMKKMMMPMMEEKMQKEKAMEKSEGIGSK